MAERRVRTPQGITRYDRPIGAVIAAGTPVYGTPAYVAAGGPVAASLPKVISLYQRLLTAKENKDRGMQKSLMPTFQAALHSYATGRDPAEVIYAVQAGAAALGKQREQNDAQDAGDAPEEVPDDDAVR